MPKVSRRGRRKLWNITGLFFVCPTNTGYLRMIGILHPAKQIQLLSKSKLLEDIIKADGKFDLTAELEKLKEEHFRKRKECLLM
uniref:Uncharacterized protein n=1 Tax=Brassica campestris TaxID=3711 RepID=A0A3P6C0D4_BRACM|nr:unnamed protein product [Brassica rapa]